MLKATSAEAGVLSWSESRDKMLYASQGVLGESVLSQSREMVWWDEKILREVMETGKAKLWHNLSTNRVESYATHAQARLAVPLRQGNQVVGVINLESSMPNVFTDEDLHFVRNVADQVTIALKNTILQRQVETEQKYFSLLMESVNNGVWVVDNRLNLLAQNKAANKITGWWSTNPVGQALSDLLPSDNGSAPKLCRLISQAMEERHSVLFDKGIFLPTQEKYPILIGGRVFPIIQDDRAAGAICSFWKVYDESQEATRKFEFADMAAHLLRTPLNLIQTSVDLLMSSKLDDQSQQRTLKRMKEQSQRLTEFTTELLRMLRLEVEGSQLQPERVYLPEITQRLVNILREEKEYHTFGFIAPSDVPMVSADPTKTELVLLNLLLSAIRRCSVGGHIEVGLQIQGKEVVVTVIDNGQALQGKQLNQIFQQFYPVDDGYNKLPSTYHLGLYTTKRLVELQNGRIWAKSQPGYGSQFYFSLPIWE
jgi:signal transduction histidine kinase